MPADNQIASSGVDTPAETNAPAGSPIKLLVIIAVLLAALLIFGALDH
jgi:hypothetical protein